MDVTETMTEDNGYETVSQATTTPSTDSETTAGEDNQELEPHLLIQGYQDE